MVSKLEHHHRFRKVLIPPLNRLPIAPNQIFWHRDLLPEFLWIDALVAEFGESAAASVFNDFLSALDPLNPDDKVVLDGTITAFGLVPADLRGHFVQAFSGKVEWAVTRPFGQILALYPNCPMAWLLNKHQTFDLARGLGQVRNAVIRLLLAKDDHAGFCRALPLNRYFAHNKVHISSDLADTIEAIKTYPHGDRKRAESFARNLHNQMLQMRAEKDPTASDWAKEFWNRNGALSPCSL